MNKLASISIITFSIIMLTGFTSDNESKKYPLSIYASFNELEEYAKSFEDNYKLYTGFQESGMESYTDYIKLNQLNKKELTLRQQFDISWDSEKSYEVVTLENEKGERKSDIANSCESIIRLFSAGYEPKNYNLFSNYLIAYNTCKALDIIISLDSSNESYVNNFKLSEQEVRNLPKGLAFIPSTMEYNRILNDSKIKTLAEVVKIKKFTSTGTNQITAKVEDSTDGTQYMGIIAKGDFNDDKVEDVVLGVTNTVVGGTYETLFVYVLTKMKKDDDWIILAQFPEL